MLTLEQIEALEAKARNCRDNARAELVVRAAFEAEFNQGAFGAGRTKEMHARSMELYDFVIRGKHRADNFTNDAELFEAAAAMGRALPTLAISAEMMTALLRTRTEILAYMTPEEIKTNFPGIEVALDLINAVVAKADILSSAEESK